MADTAARLAFITESNRIEDILRPPTQGEIDAHDTIWSKQEITVADLEDFVAEVAGRPLRRRLGQNVRVGRHIPPPGGPGIEEDLKAIFAAIQEGDVTPYETHQRYELLHPFLDGNGRSGRALWAWHMMRDGLDSFALPFLHRWYYQSLDAAREQP
jgi:Fic/DOC family